MRCDRAREILSDQHNGELEPSEEEKLQQHLAGCEACRGAREELEETLKLLAQAEAPELPAGFRGSLRQRLEQDGRVQAVPVEPASAAPRPAWSRALQAAGLVLAGAAAVLLILLPRTGDRKPTRMKCPAPTAVAVNPPAPRAPSQRLALGQVAVLVLNIRAEQAQPAARLQVVLPDGVALLGEGRQEIQEKRMSWTARLDRGDNEIRIPVKARRAGTWRLVARAQAEGFRASSETRLVVKQS